LQLIKQFLSETFLMSAIVIIAASVSIRFFLPPLNNFLDKNIPIRWLNWQTGVLLVLTWLVVSLLSGLYPAFVLSGFNPVTALKQKITTPKGSMVMLRRGLVVFQFLTAQVLIIGAIIVAKQMGFIQSRPLGFDKERVVDIDLPESKASSINTLRDRLDGISGISSFSFSLGGPVSDNRVNTDFNRKEIISTQQLNVKVIACDRNYLKTYGLHLLAGRWFDENDERQAAVKLPDSLKHYAFVLNEKAIKALGYTSPQEALGKQVTYGINNVSAPVIGVVKDYNVASLHEAVSPVLMVVYPPFFYNVGIKFTGGYSAASLKAIEKAWTAVYPNDLFESHFLDESIASQYKNEKRTQQLFSLFTFISIVINILGLLGLLSFVIEQKTKEIGIRKILGASLSDISFILSKDFIKLILLAFLVAAPLAWVLMNNWLRGFAYRTTISWWVFGAAVITILVITCIAIAFQTVKAALTNPIKSLKTE
jgi:ABC-type antimicrobial peptide transport system permease subunit